ncbi:MAG: hypothetical protein M1833_003086 [Piccolia ochrophora]|nr:MAG: hypothetical protein M1833_003086 [Piccolia ochrophora]
MPPARQKRSSAVQDNSQSARRRETLPLPQYQPILNPLAPTAQNILDSLVRTHSSQKLKQHLAAACLSVTEAAGDINDRLTMKEARALTERLRRRRDPQSSPDDESERALEELRGKVNELTEEMEASTRSIIDVQAKLASSERVLKGVQQAAGSGALGPIDPPASQQRRRNLRAGVDDEDLDEEMSDDFLETPEGERDPTSENATGPVAFLRKGLQSQSEIYQAQSMRLRYATHNDYIGFKRIVHDALHPSDDAPPVPHADTWFPASSQTPFDPGNSGSLDQSQRPRTGADEIDSDDDIAIAREKTSLKCPITLLPFENPVTSKKCPHSFEQEAILSMISQSQTRVGGNGRGEGEPSVQCPVCEKMLTKDDVYLDQVLIRRIKRIQQVQDDSDNEESGAQRGSQRNVPEQLDDSTLSGMSPAAKRISRGKSATVKQERSRRSRMA